MTLYLDLVFKYQVYHVRDNEVLVDSEEIESKPDLRKDHMKRQLTGLGDICREKTRSRLQKLLGDMKSPRNIPLFQ
jgi:hypothetical protein